MSGWMMSWVSGLSRVLAVAILLAPSSYAVAQSDPSAALLGDVTLSAAIPVSEHSYPFARSRNVDLEGAGYEESEHFVSGKANVYDWNADATKPVVQIEGGPYTNRILVRRPKDPARFNGKVFVELLNPSAGYDVGHQWALLHEFLLARGWAYIGITVKPVAIKSLKMFDAKRYAALSWANPLTLTARGNCSPVPLEGERETENGLVWDIITHTAALAKSTGSKALFPGYDVKRVYAGGWSQTGGFLLNYANGFATVKLASGDFLIDGYLNESAGLGGPPPQLFTLRQCAQPPAPGDSRYFYRPRPTPVIAIATAMDTPSMFPSLQPDSDAADRRFRMIHLPGGSHRVVYEAPFRPAPGDIDKTGHYGAGGDVPPECTMQRPNDFPQHYVLNAALDNLDRWASLGEAPPKFDLIAMDWSVRPPKFLFDGQGNLIGGYRTPYVDVPIAAYVPENGPGCRHYGHVRAFTAETLRTLYKSKDDYVSKVQASVDGFVRRRALTQEDGARIVEEAKRANIP